MGGTFTSRLNNILREEKGYTYGAYCSFIESPTGTTLKASTSVRKNATAPALDDLLATLSSAQKGFSAEEWQKVVIPCATTSSLGTKAANQLFRLWNTSGVPRKIATSIKNASWKSQILLQRAPMMKRSYSTISKVLSSLPEMLQKSKIH